VMWPNCHSGDRTEKLEQQVRAPPPNQLIALLCAGIHRGYERQPWGVVSGVTRSCRFHEERASLSPGNWSDSRPALGGWRHSQEAALAHCTALTLQSAQPTSRRA